MKSVFNLFLNILDYNHKKKIIKFLKKILGNKKIFIIDVGAHLGETFFLFSEKFNINKIICFELSNENFKKLKKKITKKKYEFNYELKNIGLGNATKEIEYNYTSETSSTTLCKINKKSKYFIYKNKVIQFFLNSEYILDTRIGKIDKLSNQVNFDSQNHIDLLKIDTEGYEFEVIKGLGEKIKFIDYILFEHHYDLMILKNYGFNSVNDYLMEKNFKKIFKAKMPFRKTFEYIYKNQAIDI